MRILILWKTIKLGANLSRKYSEKGTASYSARRGERLRIIFIYFSRKNGAALDGDSDTFSVFFWEFQKMERQTWLPTIEKDF